MADVERQLAVVLSGGLALGAYQAGAIERLLADPQWRPAWVSGASTGAINGAIMAGNPRERVPERLKSFWYASADYLFTNPLFPGGGEFATAMFGGPRRIASALETLTYGRRGLFIPQFGSL